MGDATTRRESKNALHTHVLLFLSQVNWMGMHIVFAVALRQKTKAMVLSFYRESLACVLLTAFCAHARRRRRRKRGNEKNEEEEEEEEEKEEERGGRGGDGEGTTTTTTAAVARGVTNAETKKNTDEDDEAIEDDGSYDEEEGGRSDDDGSSGWETVTGDEGDDPPKEVIGLFAVLAFFGFATATQSLFAAGIVGVPQLPDFFGSGELPDDLGL